MIKTLAYRQFKLNWKSPVRKNDIIDDIQISYDRVESRKQIELLSKTVKIDYYLHNPRIKTLHYVRQ